MSFIVSGLPVETFEPLFGLSDAELAERGAVRVTADDGRYPCRVTLEDAPTIERILGRCVTIAAFRDALPHRPAA